MKFKYTLIFLGSLLIYSAQSSAATPRSSDRKYYTEQKTMNDYEATMRSPRPQIIKFYTDTCGACKSMEPVFNEVARTENTNVDFSAIKIDDKIFEPLIKKHNLIAVPTTIFVRNGKEVKQDKGSMTEDDLRNQVKIFAESKGAPAA